MDHRLTGLMDPILRNRRAAPAARVFRLPTPLPAGRGSTTHGREAPRGVGTFGAPSVFHRIEAAPEVLEGPPFLILREEAEPQSDEPPYTCGYDLNLNLYLLKWAAKVLQTQPTSGLTTSREAETSLTMVYQTAQQVN